MRNPIRFVVGLLSMATVIACFSVHVRDRAEAASRPQAERSVEPASANAQSASAEPEALYGPSFAYLAWSLFLQAMAPNNGSLTFVF